MRYISFLKKAFTQFSNCHFILTTHSHFFISDLEGDTSFISGLKRNKSEITTVDIDRDTFGWSAEEVLYKVFNVRTTRNYYLEMHLRELLYLVSIKSEEKKKISDLIEILKEVQLTPEDPLRKIVTSATNYLAKL